MAYSPLIVPLYSRTAGSAENSNNRSPRALPQPCNNTPFTQPEAKFYWAVTVICAAALATPPTVTTTG